MKLIFILGVLTISINSFSQKTDSLKFGSKITSEDIRERFLNKYVDSLKNYDKTFPKTLMDLNFDKKNYTKWRNMHKPECLRRAVLAKIFDITLLLNIKNKLKKYTQENRIENDIPFSAYTLLELIEIRIEELKNYE